MPEAKKVVLLKENIQVCGRVRCRVGNMLPGRKAELAPLGLQEGQP